MCCHWRRDKTVSGSLALIKAWCNWQGASTDMMIKTRDLLYCLKPLWYFFWSHTIIQYQTIYFELSRTTICRFALTCQVPIEIMALKCFEWTWFDIGDLQVPFLKLSNQLLQSFEVPSDVGPWSPDSIFLALKSSKGDVKIHWKISYLVDSICIKALFFSKDA